jgi:hydrogenase nickel incorporation protein HypA/HybF
MHELSVATALVEQVLAVMAREGAHELVAVTVSVGVLSGVEPDALAFCFPLAIEGTLLQGSRLHLEMVPVQLQCRSCGLVSQPETNWLIRCLACGSGEVEIMAGHDLVLCSMEVN